MKRKRLAYLSVDTRSVFAWLSHRASHLAYEVVVLSLFTRSIA